MELNKCNMLHLGFPEGRMVNPLNLVHLSLRHAVGIVNALCLVWNPTLKPSKTVGGAFEVDVELGAHEAQHHIVSTQDTCPDARTDGS